MALITKSLDSTTEAAREARRAAPLIIAMGVIIAILYFGRVLFITSIIAVTIAFILEPFVGLLMRIHLPRSLASFVVCTVALLLLYVAGLGAYSQISGLYEDLPKYGQRIGDIVDGVQQRISSLEEQTYRMLVPARQRQQQEEEERLRAQQAKKKGSKKGAAPAPEPPTGPAPIQEVRIHPERTAVGDYIQSHLNSFYQILLMASFIPFLVYFMLSWRDHINRSFLQLFHGEDRLVAARSMQPLSGFMSLVPYVGLPLAVIPPLFAALGINTVPMYVGVVVAVAMLHLVALNLLYPKIVGSRVHLNPLVVTFSLMIFGFLWDAPGLLLAIPLTAAIKAVCDNVKDLRAFGKFLGD